jgi:hypothetical protein
MELLIGKRPIRFDSPRGISKGYKEQRILHKSISNPVTGTAATPVSWIS